MAKKKGGLKIPTAADLKKKYKNAGNAAAIDIEMEESLRLPSRCIWLNWQLGGGLVYGTVNEIFGYESTGKTLLALDFAYAAQYLGGVVLFADAEQAFSKSWAKQNGLDLERIEQYDGNDVEGISDWARDQALYWRSQLTRNEPIVFICDSIAALDCIENINADATGNKAQMGNRAKAIYRHYRERNGLFKALGITQVMINQVRQKLNVSMFESSETTPGGEATKFYASIRIAITRGKQIKGHRNAKGKWVDGKQGARDRKCGQNVYVSIRKNKTAPPRDNIATEVYFTPEKTGYVGYAKLEGIKEILESENLIKRKGSRYYYKWKKEMVEICNGKDNLMPALEENDEARRRLIHKLGVNTIGKTKDRLDSLNKNLFPISKLNLKAGGSDEE